MSVTLSPPIRVFAFLGLLVAVGLVAFLFLVGRSEPGTTAAPAKPPATVDETTRSPAPVAPTTRAQEPRASAAPKSGLPARIERALRRHGVVVVVVYMPRASVDAVVRREARAGATASRAGYVQVSALSERLVRPIVAKTGVLPDPAVLVVKRPGIVTATLSVTDRDTVAQAVAQARG